MQIVKLGKILLNAVETSNKVKRLFLKRMTEGEGM
jgi:hypothetical protein